MQQRTPMAKIDNLQATTLMVAGKRDCIICFEQTENFIKQARAANKNIGSLFFENEGHGIDKWQSRMRYARRLEDLLAKYLGGRSGNFELIEPVATYLNK